MSLWDRIFFPVFASKVATGIGDLDTDTVGVANTIIGIATALAGGVAIVLLIKGGYEILSSQGDPNKINEGRETITNALLGLVLIFASVFILFIISRVLGFSIAGI